MSASLLPAISDADFQCCVQEDLCLMTTDSNGVLRFVSGAVLFPQRWSLLEKIGMDMRCVDSLKLQRKWCQCVAQDRIVMVCVNTRLWELRVYQCIVC
jgi:hypothetical protein